jgi:hypothetical protein
MAEVVPTVEIDPQEKASVKEREQREAESRAPAASLD